MSDDVRGYKRRLQLRGLAKTPRMSTLDALRNRATMRAKEEKTPESHRADCTLTPCRLYDA